MARSSPSRFKEGLRWIRPVLTSRQFWLGLAGLGVGFVFFLLLMNYALMPLWTRRDGLVAVPEVRQLPASEAEAVIERAGLRAERQAQPFNPNLPPDIVVDQTPLPNASVKPGRRIYYYVNESPKEMVTVPSVVTLSEGVARSEITEAGLLVGQVQTDTVRTPYEGTVTRQTPPAGSAVPVGSQVTLWLSPGLGRREVRVPDVTGLPPDQARDVIRQTGLWVDSPNARADTVRWQEPRAGMPLREGSEVRIHTTEPPEGWNRAPTPPREPEAEEPTPDEEPIPEPEAETDAPAPPPAPEPDDEGSGDTEEDDGSERGDG